MNACAKNRLKGAGLGTLAGWSVQYLMWDMNWIFATAVACGVTLIVCNLYWASFKQPPPAE